MRKVKIDMRLLLVERLLPNMNGLSFNPNATVYLVILVAIQELSNMLAHTLSEDRAINMLHRDFLALFTAWVYDGASP